MALTDGSWIKKINVSENPLSRANIAAPHAEIIKWKIWYVLIKCFSLDFAYLSMRSILGLGLTGGLTYVMKELQSRNIPLPNPLPNNPLMLSWQAPSEMKN